MISASTTYAPRSVMLIGIVCLQDKTSITYRPVHMEPLDNEMEYVPPKVRSY